MIQTIINFMTAKYKKLNLIKFNFKASELIQLHFESQPIELNKIKELIEFGGDVNSVNESNGLEWTILNYAVIDKNISLVKFLIEHKANVNAKNSDRLTPLWYSIAQKNKRYICFADASWRKDVTINNRFYDK